jgi:mannose-1-phosphate guanylyltransferase/mannose-1-phosphate guanylyltransferase/mannose-6-phosphate isomerase
MLSLSGSETMLQMTLARVADSNRFNDPVLVAAADQAEAIETQLDTGGPAGRLILEPVGRNTAPAIALAALAADPDELLLVMPSDHLIRDPTLLLEAVAAATPLAEQGWLITFGIKPHRPEPGFGYIRRGEELGPGIFKAERFVEKPDAATAAAYLAAGAYEWNAGMFLFRADAYLDALATHAPDIEAAVRAALDGAENGEPHVRPDPRRFEQIRAQSIDHAVMEHSDRVAVVPVTIDWSDVGSWQALYEASEKNPVGNATAGDVIAIDTVGSLIRSEGPLVVAIGVQDLAIVATEDAILIVPRSDSQRVQEAVALLREQQDRRL